MKTLDGFRSRREELGIQLRKLRANFERFGAGLSAEYVRLYQTAIADLQKQLAELDSQLNEIGEAAQSAFDQLFDNFIDRSVTAREAFRNFITGMATDIAKFLFSQQVTTFLKNFGLLTGNISGGHLFGGAARGVPAGAAASWGDQPEPSPYYAMGSRFAHLVGSITPPMQASLRERGGAPIVNITNNAPVDVQAKLSRDSTGQRTLDISINQRMAQAINSGALDPVLAHNFGVIRRAR